MPITYSGYISIVDHVVPALIEAGFTVKPDPQEYGAPFWHIEPYTTIRLHMGKKILLSGPVAELAAKSLLEKCRPYGEEIEVEVSHSSR